MRSKKKFTFRLLSQFIFFFIVFINLNANEVKIVAKIENDIITKINGININSIDDIDKIVKSRNYYDPISIEILTSQNKIERFNFR